MRKYDKYRDSEIKYLGGIPKHWKIARLKDLGSLQNGVSKGKEYFGLGHPFVSYGNIYHGTINIENIDKLANSNEGEQDLYSVNEGDVFFTRTSETIEEIGISSTALNTIPKATFSGFAIRLRPNKKEIFKGYSNYYFKANINRVLLRKEISLVTRASLGQGTLNKIPVILPPLQEQTQIANYLDQKTKAIDKKIKLLQQKIDYYNEYKKALINETVCKGLDKRVKVKDSVLGFKIPIKWKQFRLKDIGYLYSGLSGKKGDDFNKDHDHRNRGFIPFTNIANNNNIDKEQLGYVIIGENEKQNEVRKGDIFFLMSSEGYEDLGKASVLNIDIEETYLNSFCKGFRLEKDFDSEFINYLLSATNYRQFLIIEGKGFTRINLKMNKIKDFFVYLPKTKREQEEIVAYLNHKTDTIKKITDNLKKQINHLTELRKTLINDVVTGKIKVID